MRKLKQKYRPMPNVKWTMFAALYLLTTRDLARDCIYSEMRIKLNEMVSDKGTVS